MIVTFGKPSMLTRLGPLLLIPAMLLACAQPAPVVPTLSPTPPSPTIDTATKALATNTPPVASPVRSSDQAHPRLLLTADDIPRLQDASRTTHAAIWQPILSYAEGQQGDDPLLVPPPDSDTEWFRQRGDHLLPISLACVIDGGDGLCDTAKRTLLAYVAWEQWDANDERDLGHAHMLMGTSLAYDWLAPNMTTKEQQIVRQHLSERARQLYEASATVAHNPTWRNWWASAFAQNHSWTTHSALMMASLALLDEDDRADMWLDRAAERLGRIQYLLNGIGDCSWHESIAYQVYGLTMMLPSMRAMRDVTGVDILPHDYLQQCAVWFTTNHIPNTNQFILAYGDFEWDWFNGSRVLNVVRTVAHEYHDGRAEWMAQRYSAEVGRYDGVWQTPGYVFEFLAYDPTIAPQAPSDDLLSVVFPDLTGVIWRTGWEANDLIFGFKAGVYGGRFPFDTFTQEVHPWDPPCWETRCALNIGHDHSDTNTFYLYAGGRWLAPEHEGNDKTDTSYHNTLLIDGQGQYRPPPDRFGHYPEDIIGSDGFLRDIVTTEHINYLAADATNRYINIDGINAFVRHVIFVRPSYFLMLDTIRADSPHQYDWLSHIGESATREDSWIRADAGGDMVLGIGVVMPESFDVMIEEQERPFVQIRPPAPVDDIRFLHVLYPTTQNEWDTRPSATLLETLPHAIAMEVMLNDGSGRTDTLLLTDEQPHSGPVDIGGYTYDAQMAMIRRSSNEDLERITLYGGTFLRDTDRGIDLVRNVHPYEPLEVSYTENTLNVVGFVNDQVWIYAPAAEHVFVNGMPHAFTREGETIRIAGQAQTSILDTIRQTAQLVGRTIGTGTVVASDVAHHSSAMPNQVTYE